MIIELHILQNFAPSNLNRDDTGAPKDCEFGGYRRARLSSQAIKRAARQEFKKLLPKEQLATRTKRLVDEVAKRLAEDHGRDSAQARGVVQAALASVKIEAVAATVNDEPVLKTQYLLYLGEAEIAGVTALCAEHWDTLAAAAPQAAEPAAEGGRGRARDTKRAGRDAVPAEFRKALEALLDGGKAADLALFGRMLADLPERNIDAASQVAHALSTHQVSVEFDYYTAVDDLKPEDTAGADMIGTVEFNSACYYRYANVDTAQLIENLGKDEELARETVGAYLQALIAAIPTGKQNSFAAQNPPSFVMSVVRPSGLWSLANAFVQPVRPGRDRVTGEERDLVDVSVRALGGHWEKLAMLYGAPAGSQFVATLTDSETLGSLKGQQVASVPVLIQQTVSAAFGGAGGAS